MSIGNAGTSNIWIYDLALRTTTQLTNGASNGVPEWTPDGKSILFRSNRSGRGGIWKQLATGAAQPELVYQSEDQINEAILSPDEKWLIYRTGPAAKHPSDIFAVPMIGERKPIALATGPSFETMPRVSPDGRWLAYEKSGESGQPEIYVQPFPESGAPVKVSIGGGREPLWAKSGRALYYRTQDGAVISVAVNPGSSLSLGERRAALAGSYEIDQSHQGYDVAPDGNQFLMLKRSGGAARPIIVYNWGRELREKIAVGKK
jgi:Tol biopolymer transport system component